MPPYWRALYLHDFAGSRPPAITMAPKRTDIPSLRRYPDSSRDKPLSGSMFFGTSDDLELERVIGFKKLTQMMESPTRGQRSPFNKVKGEFPFAEDGEEAEEGTEKERKETRRHRIRTWMTRKSEKDQIEDPTANEYIDASANKVIPRGKSWLRRGNLGGSTKSFDDRN